MLNKNQTEQIKLVCCAQGHQMNTQVLWLWFIYTFDEVFLKVLKDHIHTDSIENLSLFILQQYQELKIPCDVCKNIDYSCIE